MALTDGELVELLSDLESDRVERKQLVKEDKEKLSQAICAFATTCQGTVGPGCCSSASRTTAGSAACR